MFFKPEFCSMVLTYVHFENNSFLQKKKKKVLFKRESTLPPSDSQPFLLVTLGSSIRTTFLSQMLEVDVSKTYMEISNLKMELCIFHKQLSPASKFNFHYRMRSSLLATSIFSKQQEFCFLLLSQYREIVVSHQYENPTLWQLRA